MGNSTSHSEESQSEESQSAASIGVFDTSLVSEHDPDYNRLQVESGKIKQKIKKSLDKYTSGKTSMKTVSASIHEGVEFNKKIREKQSKVKGMGAHSRRQQWGALIIDIKLYSDMIDSYTSQSGFQSGYGKRRKVSKRRKASSKNKRKKTKRKKTNKK